LAFNPITLKGGRRGMNAAGRSVSARVALLITVLFVGTSLLSVVSAQSDNPKVLSHENNRLYFYGESADGGYATWPMWNNAQSNDPNSDDSIGETNAFIPGDPNNGGGTREFTFDGEVASDNITEINPEITITGNFRLNIFCQGGSCNTDVTIYLRKGGVDITSLTVSPENEGGDTYVFEFFHNIKEIKGGETMGMRIQFTKPSGAGDGYTLYLGQNNFQMDVPVIPPETSDIGDVLLDEGGIWTSPYSNSELGFKSSTSENIGLIFPIFLGIILLAGAICGVVFTPGMPFITAGTIIAAFSLMGTAVIAPLASYMDMAENANVEMDPMVYTVDEFAALEASQGSFLTEFSTGDEFKIWVPFNGDTIYSKTMNIGGRAAIVWGLGFQEHDELLGNPETTTVAGREAIQLYFSSIIQFTDGTDCETDGNTTQIIVMEEFDHCGVYDLSQSGGVMMRIELGTDADGNVRPINNRNVTLTDGSPRQSIIWTDTVLCGTPVSWKTVPLFGLIPALGCLGFGAFTVFSKKKRSSISEDDEYFDEDMDDLDDLEDLDF